jgi:hypothetical protein
MLEDRPDFLQRSEPRAAVSRRSNRTITTRGQAARQLTKRLEKLLFIHLFFAHFPLW